MIYNDNMKNATFILAVTAVMMTACCDDNPDPDCITCSLLVSYLDENGESLGSEAVLEDFCDGETLQDIYILLDERLPAPEYCSNCSKIYRTADCDE